MITELPGISRWEAFAIDLHKCIVVESSIRTVSHEASVPLLNGFLIIAGVHNQKVEVSLRNSVLATLCAHLH